MPGMDPPPDNLIMNGQSLFDCSIMRRDTTHKDPFHDMMEHGGPMEDDNAMEMDLADPPPVKCNGGSRYKTRVKSGQNLRLRLISHSTATPFWFTIDNHTLSLVEIDGVEVEPISTSRVFMYPGQRYSVIVSADQTSGNYLMRALAATHCFHMPMHGHHGKPTAFASVNYQTAALLSYDDTEDDATPLGIPWDITSSSNAEFGKEPWKGNCRDLPFGRAKPIRAMPAYDVGEGNYHYFTYRKSRALTIINEVCSATSRLRDILLTCAY
jgi:FtsP/CotA-like multicopper oxidase with cupredoxin domain